MDFAVPADQGVELKEYQKREKYIDFAGELKKTVEHERDNYTNSNWCSGYRHQRIGTRTGGLENTRTGGEDPNSSITEIGQKTEKSPGDFGKLAVTQTSVKDHQLTLM